MGRAGGQPAVSNRCGCQAVSHLDGVPGHYCVIETVRRAQRAKSHWWRTTSQSRQGVPAKQCSVVVLASFELQGHVMRHMGQTGRYPAVQRNGRSTAHLVRLPSSTEEEHTSPDEPGDTSASGGCHDHSSANHPPWLRRLHTARLARTSACCLRHNGSLHRVDENGLAALIEKRSSAGDMKFFESLARIANGTRNCGHTFLHSDCCAKAKRHKGPRH